MAKTANLLVDGLGLGSGDLAAVVLPAHWQTFAILAGCWAAGIHVVTEPSGDEAVTITAEGWTRPGAASLAPASETLLLSLRPLGQGLQQPAPAGTTDYAADVRTYGDRFTGPAVSPQSAALDDRSHLDLIQAAEQVTDRILVAPAGDPAYDAALVVSGYLAVLRSGSVVLCRRADRTALPRRLEVERAVLR